MDMSIEKQAEKEQFIAKREAERDEFFEQLSAEREAPFREAVLDALHAEGGSARLNKISADWRVRQAKAVLFPRSGAVNISAWIQRRMAGELVVQPDPVARDNQILSFVDASLTQETSTSRRLPAKGKGGDSSLSRKGDGGAFGPLIYGAKGIHRQTPYGKGGRCKGSAGALGPQTMPSDEWKGGGPLGPPPRLTNGKGKKFDNPDTVWSAKGEGPTPYKSKGKGQAKTQVKQEQVERHGGQALATAHVAKRHERPSPEIVLAERDAFFESLPADAFVEQEAVLLDSFLDKLRSVGGSCRLNLVVSEPSVKTAKAAFLPMAVGISHWIERRVSNYLALEPDPVALNNQIVTMIDEETAQAPESDQPPNHAPSRNEIVAAQRDAFFEGLPPRDFVQEEVVLAEALLAKLESMGGSGRLNNVVSDPSVKEAKIQLLPKGVGIAHWIERRVSNQLKVEPDPVARDNQIVSIIGVSEAQPPNLPVSEVTDKQKEKMAEREAFFGTLPAGRLSSQEVALVDALREKLRSTGGSGRLNTVVVDPKVKQAKTALLTKGVGIASWIDNRVAYEFTVEPDPVALNNQIVRFSGGDSLAKRRKIWA